MAHDMSDHSASTPHLMGGPDRAREGNVACQQLAVERHPLVSLPPAALDLLPPSAHIPSSALSPASGVFTPLSDQIQTLSRCPASEQIPPSPCCAPEQKLTQRLMHKNLPMPLAAENSTLYARVPSCSDCADVRERHSHSSPPQSPVQSHDISHRVELEPQVERLERSATFPSVLRHPTMHLTITHFSATPIRRQLHLTSRSGSWRRL